MNHSIITEFQQDVQFSPAKNSQYPLPRSPDNYGEDIYTNKLQAKVKQLKANIKKNKPLIEQLKAQRKFLKKICEKQRQKIQGARIQLIKGEYENEIEQLRQEKHKLQDIIAVIHQQSSSKAQDFVQAKSQINQNFLELNKALQQIRKENIMYEEMIISKTQAIDLKVYQTSLLDAEIKGKENVEKKYKEVMGEIQVLQQYRR